MPGISNYFNRGNNLSKVVMDNSRTEWRDNKPLFNEDSSGSPEDVFDTTRNLFDANIVNAEHVVVPDSKFPQFKEAASGTVPKTDFFRKPKLHIDFNKANREKEILISDMNDFEKKDEREFKRLRRTLEDYMNVGLQTPGIGEPEQRPPPRQNYNIRNNFLSFKDALHLLPDYEGKPENLFSFCRYLENLITTYGNECESHVLQVLPRKLKGRAAQIFEGSVYSYGSLKEFIKALKLQFGAMQDGETVRSRLRNIAQYKGEPVEDYALRVQLLEQKLITIYEASTELDHHEKLRNKDRAKQEALDCFIYGLRNPPEYRVSARNPKTLAEAVNIAIRLEGRDESISYQEKLYNKKTKSSMIGKSNNNYDSDSDDDLREYIVRAATATKILCGFCKSTLHESKNCPGLPKIIDLIQSLNINNNNRNNNINTVNANNNNIMPNNGTQIARINPNNHFNRDNFTNNMIEYNNGNRTDNRNFANDINRFNNFNRFNPDREFFRGYSRNIGPRYNQNVVRYNGYNNNNFNRNYNSRPNINRTTNNGNNRNYQGRSTYNSYATQNRYSNQNANRSYNSYNYNNRRYNGNQGLNSKNLN